MDKEEWLALREETLLFNPALSTLKFNDLSDDRLQALDEDYSVIEPKATYTHTTVRRRPPSYPKRICLSLQHLFVRRCHCCVPIFHLGRDLLNVFHALTVESG